MIRLAQTIFFQDWRIEAIEQFLKCVPHQIKTYQKEEIVLAKGTLVEELGIVMEGRLFLQDIDFWGNRTIFLRLEESDVFGETFACLHQLVQGDVMASCPSRVLFISPENMMKQDKRFASLFIQLLAHKNLLLTTKMRHMSMRSTQDKVFAYLSDMAWQSQSSTFQVPYNRQELADYLAVERSALSFVLSKLAKAGYIQYHKNTFILKKGTV